MIRGGRHLITMETAIFGMRVPFGLAVLPQGWDLPQEEWLLRELALRSLGRLELPQGSVVRLEEFSSLEIIILATNLNRPYQNRKRSSRNDNFYKRLSSPPICSWCGIS